MFYWACLVGAGICECVWAIGMKYTCGFTRLWPSVITLAAMPSSMYLLSLSLKALPIGTAYAVWTGIGAVTTAIMGMILFREPATVEGLEFKDCLIRSGKGKHVPFVHPKTDSWGSKRW